MGLSPQSHWGTGVSPATPGQQCFLSPPLRDAHCNLATADMGSISAPLTLDTPVPQPGIKWWHPSSNQGMPNLGQEEEVPCDLPEGPP